MKVTDKGGNLTLCCEEGNCIPGRGIDMQGPTLESQERLVAEEKRWGARMGGLWTAKRPDLVFGSAAHSPLLLPVAHRWSLKK